MHRSVRSRLSAIEHERSTEGAAAAIGGGAPQPTSRPASPFSRSDLIGVPP